MIAVAQHIWVKHTITPVQILEDETGNPVIFVDPDQQIIAEDHAVYGCQVCNEPLAGNERTDCSGDDDIEMP